MRPNLPPTIVLIAFVLTAPCLASTAAAGWGESLGSKLLDDLNAGLQELPAATPAAETPGLHPPAANRPPGSQPPQPAATTPAAPAMIPLVRVRQGMQQAHMLLAELGVGTHAGTLRLASPAQQEVVAELDKLIAELSKQCQCQGGQCNKPPQPNANEKPGSPKPGSKPGNATARSRSPARDSNDRLDHAAAQPAGKGDVADLVKQLWGHLPERSRAQMLQSFSDEFLPKYGPELEQYYRRLSEELPEQDPRGNDSRFGNERQ